MCTLHRTITSLWLYTTAVVYAMSLLAPYTSILYCTYNITQRCAMRCNVASLFTQRVFMSAESSLFTGEEGGGRCNRVLNKRIPLVIREKLCSGYWHTRGIGGFNGALGSSISLSVQYLFIFTQFSAKILPNNRSAP